MGEDDSIDLPYGERIPTAYDIEAIGAVMRADHGITLTKDEHKKIRKMLTAYLDQFVGVSE